MPGTALEVVSRVRTSVQPGNPWLVPAGASPSLPAMLIFPHAGAGSVAYRRFARQFSDVAAPLTVRLPGRESRLNEPAYTDIRPMVRALVPAVLPHLRGRFVLYGHSMGALVAFETARVLQHRYGMSPAHLVVSGMAAPRSMSRRDRQRHLLPDDQLWQVVRDIGGIPDEAAGNPAMRELVLPVTRADFEVVDGYVYRPMPALTCQTTSFAGRSDREAPPAETTGWDKETRGVCTHEVVPGDHFFNLDGDGSRFVQALRELLARLPIQPA